VWLVCCCQRMLHAGWQMGQQQPPRGRTCGIEKLRHMHGHVALLVRSRLASVGQESDCESERLSHQGWPPIPAFTRHERIRTVSYFICSKPRKRVNQQLTAVETRPIYSSSTIGSKDAARSGGAAPRPRHSHASARTPKQPQPRLLLFPWRTFVNFYLHFFFFAGLSMSDC
jgi:hypothetical protein